MFLSVLDLFKPGIGPSSSHTVGPMTAAGYFINLIRISEDEHVNSESVERISVSLHGSLAFTGRGHATDTAIILGLSGHEAKSINPNEIDTVVKTIRDSKTICQSGFSDISFNPSKDIIFDYKLQLPLHSNGMIFKAYSCSGEVLLSETYYSTGGGFVESKEELEATLNSEPMDMGNELRAHGCPYPFSSATEMVLMGRESNLSISQMKRENENIIIGSAVLDEGLDEIWKIMNDCINRGLQVDGTLPGGLGVKRRSKQIAQRLEKRDAATNLQQPHECNDWIAVYAMAVNEENAAGGRVVTAPTNGAAGVIPAVIRYYLDLCQNSRLEDVPDFLLTAAAVGGIIKTNASISGADCGCQAEVGSAAAMAAAGLCAVLGGSNEQIENAAEIALEHHLGMTCDPIQGLVQVPCIERNGMGAIKAVSAASLALHGDGTHLVPLDNCIETMRQTGKDMSEKYKETSLGGLAVNLPEC